MVMDALQDRSARANSIPFCEETEALELVPYFKSTRIHDQMVRAGAREALSLLDLQAEWKRRRRI